MVEVGGLLFLVGVVLSLGSISTFIVMNVTVGSSSDPLLIHHQRLFAAAGSRWLTIPGVCMLLAAGILTTGSDAQRGLDGGWDIAQLALSASIFANTMIFVRPLVARVSLIAEGSAAGGKMLEGYRPLKGREDRFGMANFLMIVGVLVLVAIRAEMHHCPG